MSRVHLNTAGDRSGHHPTRRGPAQHPVLAVMIGLDIHLRQSLGNQHYWAARKSLSSAHSITHVKWTGAPKVPPTNSKAQHSGKASRKTDRCKSEEEELLRSDDGGTKSR